MLIYLLFVMCVAHDILCTLALITVTSFHSIQKKYKKKLETWKQDWSWQKIQGS